MKIFSDPKFLTLLADTVVSLVLYFAGKYAAPGVFEDIKVFIGAIQPIALIILVNLFQREAVALRAGVPPKHLL